MRRPNRNLFLSGRTFLVSAICGGLWCSLFASTAQGTSASLAALNAATLSKFNTVLATPTPAQAQDLSDLLPLYRNLSAREEVVRLEAIQALGLVGGPMAALLLVHAVSDSLERSSAVRAEAATQLGEIGGRQALETLGIAICDRNVTVRIRAVEASRFAGTVFAIPYIDEVLKHDTDSGVRLEGVRILRKIGTAFSVIPLETVLRNDGDLGVRLAAADALGEVGKKERSVAGVLGSVLTSGTERNVSVRLEIVKSLGLVRDKAGLTHLTTAMHSDPDLTIRRQATETYGRILGLH